MKHSYVFFLSSAIRVFAADFLIPGAHRMQAKPRLFARQDTTCQLIPPPYTCERSCGPDFRQCQAFPNCFNPSAGETCCSDGKYCPAGTYCTDAGCCPAGSSLAECGAAQSLNTVPGQAASTAAAPPSSMPPSPSMSVAPTTTANSVTSSPAPPPTPIVQSPTQVPPASMPASAPASVSQISDGQVQAPTATNPTSPTAPAVYTGMASKRDSIGTNSLVAILGLLIGLL